MRIAPNRKLFVCVKIDNKLRDGLAQCPARDKAYFDGSDPRLAQGAISSNAVIYAGPIALQGDTRVVARARNPGQRQTGGPPISTPWSSPVTADFKVTPL